MKRFFYCLLLSTFVGCASITIPSYIPDKNPYQRTFYVPYDKVYTAAIEALNQNGWSIEKETEPVLYERERALGSDKKQILLFTQIRQAYFFIGSGYTRINIFLREKADSETEIEIRQVKVTSAVFKSFYGYRNDRMVNRIFRDMEERLDLPPQM